MPSDPCAISQSTQAVHLRYDLIAASSTEHAQDDMRRLGIDYVHATPQSIADQWWFWGCTNVPSVLPPYLSLLKTDPHKQIGYGLSEVDADRIVAAMEAARAKQP